MITLSYIGFVGVTTHSFFSVSQAEEWARSRGIHHFIIK